MVVRAQCSPFLALTPGRKGDLGAWGDGAVGKNACCLGTHLKAADGCERGRKVEAQDPQGEVLITYPRGTEDRDKGQGQGQERGQGKRRKEMGQEFLSQRDKGLSLYRRQT